MKFHFNERQRFSLRKYSFGLASVLLGTAFFLSGQAASADEVNVSETLLTSVVSVSPESSTSTSESSVPRTSESKPTVADKSALSPETADSKPTVADKPVVTPETTEVSSDSEKVATESPKSEKSEVSAKESSEDTAKTTEGKAEVEVAEKDDKSTDKAPAEARRSTRTRRATSENKREVSNWSEFVSALEDGNVSEITVNGDVVAQGDNGNTDNGRSGSVDRKTTIHAQSRPVTIQGKDGNARLELLSHTLELTGASWELNLKNLKIATANSKGPIDLSRTSGSNTVTFENVTSVGSSLYGGGGNTHVVIKGTTTSTVSDSYQAANGQTQHVQRNVGAAGHSDQRRESNIHDAKSVTVAEGASLTLNRSSQGDAITLESGAKVSVKDKASLTINMNTDNRSENARYHNAGIFMADSGTVETGKDSKLVLNTSIGQGISIGVNRPADGITDKDRYGGYVAGNHGRKNGPSRVLIGDGGTFEFHGRDGIMMGNHSELVTGQNAKVRFENKGRGVALDFGNDSRVVFGKHSNNTFHSVGKGPKSGGGPSGSYDGYNYIGLNENGKILVDDFATFRVQMDNRGDNAWDDVISLDSRNGRKSEPVFQANKGSIVDIRDDNTNYYAELISVALGASTNTYFQFNNPLYVSFMRYTKSDGTSAGEITGKLPITIPQGNNPQDIGHGNILYISNKLEASGNRVEFNGPTNNAGVGTYTVYSMNKDGRDAQSHNKQSSVWMNIQGGSMSIAGFQNNRAHIEPANATSVPTGSSTGGVVATDRTYGIDPVGDNRQNIWVSNGSKINPTGVHKNVIKYVYEDGTPVKKDVIQSSEWKRTLDVSIDQEGFKKILKNSSVSNGDEFLAAYSKAKYHISDIDGDNIADTGWKVDGTNSGTYNYGTIASPKVDGYKAEIKSTNVPGLEVGAQADSVSVSYDSSNAPETLIDAQAGKRTVSETYWRNIVAKSDLGVYETVVVYKKVKQKAIVKYIDTTANNKELAKDEVEGTSGEAINYSTAAKIADFVNKGYKLVEDGFTNSTADQKKFDSDASTDQEFVVRLEHDVTPVGPNDPHKPTEPINPNDPKSPKYPAENQWKKDVTSTVHYVVSDGNATAPADNVQNAQWTRTLKLDKVTGEVLNPTELWTANKANYDAVPTPGLTGYYADKGSVASKTVTQENLEETVTYKPLGKLVPKPETPNDPNFPSTPEVKYPNDPNDPTKPGKPVVPNVPGYKPYLPDPNYPTKPGEPGRPVEPGKPITPENPGTDTEIIYRKVDQKAIIKYVDTSANNKELAKDEVSGKSYEAINYSTAAKIADFVNKGYKLVEDGFTNSTEEQKKFDSDASTDQEFVVRLEHDVTPVGPNDPHKPTEPINPNDPNSPRYPAENQWKKDVTSTVHYVVSDGNATAPADNVQNAQWTRTLKLDKVTGEVLNPTELWTANKANYDVVPTPGLTGYYADKGSVASKTVTQENLEETVTYKPLGKLVPKPETPNDPNFPSTPEVKYPNDPNDPTKPGKPVVPNVPGYKPYLPDPNYPTKPGEPGRPVEPGTPVTPDKPGEDTPIIYVPKTNDVTQPTKQTVKYTSTDGKAQVPSDKIQNDYTFTGKKNQADGTTTWTENSHTYGRESVPVVSGYYADKSEAGSKTVTPTNPNAEDVVTYKPLGKIIQVDEDGNVIPGSVSKTYENNPLNPKEAAETKIPDAPTGYVIKEEQPQAWGYNIVDKTIEPNDESDPDRISQDTKIVYVKADQKAVIKYVDQTTGQTLANDQVGGKSGEAINYSTADKIKYYEDRGYVLVSDGFPAGATYDKDESVDQEFVVTLKHGETPVGPNDPHNPTDPINPNDPNSPKYPAKDQWTKDVTSTVHYVVSDGKATAPADNVQNAQWTRTLTLDKVTGKVLNPDAPWAANKANYAAVPTPSLTGYYADKASVASKAVTQENLEETVTYKPLGNLVPKPETPNDPNFPSTPGVKYPNDPTDPTKPGQPVVPDVPGYEPHLPDPNDPTKPGQPIQPGTPVTPDKPGEDTPIIYVPKTNDVTQPTKQTVTFEGAGSTTPKDDVQSDYTFTGKKNQADGTTTWTENSHDYGKVKVPVVEHYYADKAEAGGKTVTPEHPEATDKVVYKELGKIIPVDPDGNPIPNAPTPQYTNDPNDPTKGGVTPTPVIPGYVTDIPNVTPSNPGADTPVVYRKAEQKAVIKYVDQTTGQTLANDQVGGKSGEAINYSTADKIKYYEDRGYVLVSDEFPAGVHFDTDASVDQTWTVTLKHGETPVGPNDPHNPTDPINPNDPNSPKYPAEDQWKKDVTSTVKYVVSDGKTTAPADNVQNAQWTRTLNLDKVTGKVLNPDVPWTANKANYDAVPTPGLTGYYADKASVASKAVTQENLEETVTYKPLGNLVPKPGTPDDPNFPSTPGVKYPNDPTDPTKPGQPVVPDVPGYEPHLPDPNDPTKPGQPIQPGTPVTPDKPGEDTPIIYVPKTNDVTQPTKQTVTFEGAGSTTPKDDVQSDYTFTGKKNQADGTTTWTENSHDYGKVKVPVVTGYYADKKEAGSKTVTPDQPEVTDKVTYKPLGKIIPVDPEGNKIPSAPTPQYNNDSEDPTKGGKTPTPVIPGYVTDTPSVTPNDPGSDTPVVYRKAEQKAIIKYVDQNTGETLENDQVGGKSGEAIDYSTAAKIKYYEDRGYVLVSDEFPAGATYDTDASVDQTWTVTLKHGETPVGPNDPHKPTDPINPNDPNSPKYPAEDQWKKDVTSTVHYVVSDGKATAPADNVQNAQWTRTLNVDKVTGKVLNPDASWTANKTNYDAVPTPGLTGYYADKASVASKTVTQENLEETVTYKPLGNLVPKPERPNDPNFPSTPEVKYPNDPTDPGKPGKPVVPNVPGYKPYLPDPKDPSKPGQPVEPGKELPNLPTNPGDDTPIIYVPIVNDVKKPTKQTVKFEGAGDKTPADNVQDDFTFTGKENKASGTTTWTEKSHTYGKVSVPVIPGYYADKTEAGGKTVTPENPEATDTVTYKPLGKLVPKPERPNDPNFPSTPEVKYPNDPTDPGKPGKPVVPDVPGYKPYLPDPKDPSKPGQPVEPGKELPNLPTNPGDDTPIIYVPIVNDVKKPTKQTVKFEGAGDKTPADNVQDDFTFTGKENKASGTTTWTEKSHTYGKVSVPVIPGYYADKSEAGGKTVTPENPEATDTVTYKPLGSLVPKSDDPKFPSTPDVKYPNDPTDPGKPGKPIVPDVPGYKPYLPDPKDPSKPGQPVEPGKELPNLPTNPGDDTPIIYVPIVNDVKKPTKQTVKFEGAGDKTPADNVQDDFTFTGKENKASGTTTWTEKSYTYGKVSVPVIPGYYADKTEAGGKTVTPENPEATDTVTYKPLGKLVPKPERPNDPNFPSTPEVKYPNDPTDPGKPGKPVVPNVPGYKPYLPDPKDPSKPGKPVEPGKPITPENPGEDTPIIYVPIVNDVKKPTKQTVKFEGAGDKTPGDNVQDDFTFTGKENKASGTTTWTEKSHTYGKVSVPVIPGYYADKTEAGGKTVTPENPEATDTVTYKPLGNLVPKPERPNDPNFPSTPEVKYPNDPTDPGKPGKPVVPNVPGYKPYLPDPKDPSKPGQPVEPGKELPNLPTNPGDDTPIIYVPIVNDVKKPTKQTVKFEGAGDKTPGDNVQDDFTFTGKENKASGTTTWNEKSHTYGKVSVPVIPGYYADKTEAGGKTVTPENPEATDTVTYKPLGSLVPKSDDPKFPSTPDVKYPNDPKDPSKPGQPVVPNVPGYKPYLPDPKDPSKPGQPVEPGKPITPENPGDDTPIIYVPIVNDVTKPTKQTVKFEGAGDKTPGDNVQDDFTFTGKENKASGTTTWNEKNHTYGKVSVPVIPGYYADKTEAGSKTVTPENPEATDTVTYKPLGSLVPKSDDPKFPSTPDVKYPNDPTDPTKPGQPVVPDVPGYKPYLPDPKDPSKPGQPVEPGKELPNLPTNPGEDTPIIYVPIVPKTPNVPTPEPRPETPGTPNPEPKPLNPEKVVRELPNTGTDSNTVMTGLGIIGMATTLLGLSQKKKED